MPEAFAIQSASLPSSSSESQPDHPRMIVLLGAPPNSSLLLPLPPNETQLLTTYLPAFYRLFGPALSQDGGPSQSSLNYPILLPQSSGVPLWRNIPLKRKHLHTGLSQLASGRVTTTSTSSWAARVYGEDVGISGGEEFSQRTVYREQTRQARLKHFEKVSTAAGQKKASIQDERVSITKDHTTTTTTTTTSTTSTTSSFSSSIGNSSFLSFDDEAFANSISYSYERDDHTGLVDLSFDGDGTITFLDHSYSNHDESADVDSTSFLSSPSINDATATTTLLTASKPTKSLILDLPPLPPLSQLTDLEDIPTPAQILSFLPLKKKISTIVGIISIFSQPIQIPTRNNTTTTTTYPLEVIKLTVGDETAAGLGVTIWLDPLKKESHQDSYSTNNKSSSLYRRKNIRSILSTLKSQDVILMHNLSLSVYQGQVYLNSMRGLTELELLYRCGDHPENRRGLAGHVESEGVVAVDQQVEKVKRVVEWVWGHVGVEEGGGARDYGGGNVGTVGWRGGDMLPEDTQVGPLPVRRQSKRRKQ